MMVKRELETDLDFEFGRKFFVVTFHPETLSNQSSGEQFEQLLRALDRFQDYKILFTMSNADAGGREINNMITDYVQANQCRCIAARSLGHARYLSSVSISNGVIGNSSSGLIEAPSLKVGTVNIGGRQDGRVRGDSVIDCEPQEDEIFLAIERLLSDEFMKVVRSTVNPYGSEPVAARIAEQLSVADLSAITKKSFYTIFDEAS